MKPLTLLACALFGATCFARASTPDLLIVQLKYPLEGANDPNLLLAPYVADSLEKEGRVRPVVWSTLDPVFREWSDKKSFGDFDPNPTLKEVLAKAQRLGVSNVLTVQARRNDNNFVAIAELFVDGRSKWRFGPKNPNKDTDITVSTDGKYDDKATRQLQSKMSEILSSGGTFTVYTGGLPDWDASARSLANTWKTLLGEGAFKKYPPALQPIVDSTAGNSVEPKIIEIPDAKADNVVEVARAMVSKGKLNKALTLLREACDLRPYEVSVRKALAEILIEGGMPYEGAVVAQAAARIQPSDPSLWLSVAQAWVADGDIERATESLKEAQSRGADGPTVERVSADIALLSGDAQRAVDHYSKADGAGAKVRLAAAFALTGNVQGCSEALLQVPKGPVAQEDYTAIVLMVDRSMAALSKEASEVPPLVRTHPGETATLKAAEIVAKKCEALRALMTGIEPPQLHKDSHEARKLAHILLAQATLEALQFAKTNDPDIGEETVATLGQALRLFPSIRDKFGLEQRYGGL